MSREVAIADLTAVVKELVAAQGTLVAGQERLVAESMTLRDTVMEVAGQWRPQVDADMEDLHRQLGDLRTRLDVILSSRGSEQKHDGVGGKIPRADPFARGAESEYHGPSGHRGRSPSRGRTGGAAFTTGPTPAKGASSNCFSQGGELGWNNRHYHSHHAPHTRMDFPPFFGEHPRQWRCRCEAYF